MILIINNHSKNIPLIENILKKNKVAYDIKDQKTMLKSIDESRYNGIILSGGIPVLDKEIHFNTIRADIACLINCDVPILGICVGHEIIGAACGAELIKLKTHSWIPDLKIKILEKTGIFKGLPDEIIAYEHHSRYLKNVPSDLIVAASSRKDRIEAIFHRKRSIFGLQFHPEKSGKHGEKIFKNFLDICYRSARD
ncbi:MAG: gamma-glutamyl-gamma-aminobutyrate hydrolase family protein [archaeon]